MKSSEGLKTFPIEGSLGSLGADEFHLFDLKKTEQKTVNCLFKIRDRFSSIRRKISNYLPKIKSRSSPGRFLLSLKVFLRYSRKPYHIKFIEQPSSGHSWGFFRKESFHAFFFTYAYRFGARFRWI